MVTNALLVVGFAVVSLALYMMKRYLEELPSRIHDQQLESFKDVLSRERELLSIHETALHPKKMEESASLIKFFIETMLRVSKDQVYAQKFQRDGSNEQREFGQKTHDLGINLYLYGSDKAVAKWVEWNKFGELPIERRDSFTGILLLANLALQLRSDMGHVETSVSIDDFLHILLTDWGATKVRLGIKSADELPTVPLEFMAITDNGPIS